MLISCKVKSHFNLGSNTSRAQLSVIDPVARVNRQWEGWGEGLSPKNLNGIE